MAKTTQTKESNLTAIEKQQDTLTPQNVAASASEILQAFENVDESQLIGLTADYLEMKENSTYNMIFNGRTTFKNDKGVDIPAVELIDKTGKRFIHASTVLVNSLSKVTQMPCLAKIVTKGKIKSPNGSYLDMDVLVMPQTIAK